MSEKVATGRGHKISPIITKGSKFAYQPCPKSDQEIPDNCLSIPSVPFGKSETELINL